MSDLPPARRTCILVDLEKYSDLDGQRQHAAQAALAGALASASAAAGLDRLSWERQVTGDGELAVLPDGQSQVQVVGAFPIALDAALRAVHGSTGLRLRVRMAALFGVITEADLGYSGQAVVDAARMANAAEVRAAFAKADDGFLLLAVSAELYRDVVRSGHTAIEPSRFRQTSIERSTVNAWITVPGVDPARMGLEPGADTADAQTTATTAGSATAATAARDLHAGAVGPHSSAYTTNFKKPVKAETFHIGPRHG